MRAMTSSTGAKWPAGASRPPLASGSTPSTAPAGIISAGRIAPRTQVMQVQVAEVDDQTQPLAENEHGIIAMHGIDRQHDAAGDAEVPEGHRHDDALFLFAAPPLDDETHHEQALAAKTDGDPDQGFPDVSEHQWNARHMASRTSRMVSRARTRAFSQPSAMMLRTRVGSSRYICARSRIGACSLRMPSITGCLHSMQPMPALLQPCCTQSRVDSSEYT